MHTSKAEREKNWADLDGTECQCKKLLRSCLVLFMFHQEDPAFLADCASLLLENGHSQAALDICALSPPSPPHPHLSLLAVQLEAMGRLGRVVEMETLVKTVSVGSIHTYYTSLSMIYSHIT